MNGFFMSVVTSLFRFMSVVTSSMYLHVRDDEHQGNNEWRVAEKHRGHVHGMELLTGQKL